jgi:hypothetical protein
MSELVRQGDLFEPTGLEERFGRILCPTPFYGTPKAELELARGVGEALRRGVWPIPGSRRSGSLSLRHH